VAEADATVRFLSFHEGGEIINPAGGFDDLELAAVGHHYAGAVVTAVFEPPESGDEELGRLLGADVADDSAHGLDPQWPASDAGAPAD
jgi:hypothetical protein